MGSSDSESAKPGVGLRDRNQDEVDRIGVVKNEKGRHLMALLLSIREAQNQSVAGVDDRKKSRPPYILGEVVLAH